MKISASVISSKGDHQVQVRTGATSQSLDIPPKATGDGSAVNGGELLMLALATCYCNDVYREAKRLQIPIEGIEVQAEADFEGIGLAASNIRYRARVLSSAGDTAIADLLRQTDAVAEIHNTVRAGVPVRLDLD
jgi:organic hydroperoxide reductase OsmC/OhrA